MTAKSAWGLVIGGLVVLVGWIGQPLSDSLVKDGKLPDWISPKLAGFVGWLSTDVPIPLWLLVVIVGCIGAAVTVFVRLRSRAPSGADVRLAATVSLLETSHQRNLGLEESNSLLQQQLREKSQALEALGSDNFTVSAIGLRVLAAVFKSRGARSTLSSIAGIISVDPVEAHAAINVLIEQKLLEGVPVPSGGTCFRFTVKGRDYYKQQKDL